jgi:hypothetical protein
MMLGKCLVLLMITTQQHRTNVPVLDFAYGSQTRTPHQQLKHLTRFV